MIYLKKSNNLSNLWEKMGKKCQQYENEWMNEWIDEWIEWIDNNFIL